MSTIEAVLAIDIGGKSIKRGFVNERGLMETLDSCLLPFDPDPEFFFALLNAKIQEALNLAFSRNIHVIAVGIGVPGRVDERTGIAYESTNLDWPETNFKTLIEHWTGLLTFVNHDVRCGAIAENAFGALQGHTDFLYVAIGTGIGAGISLGGEMYSGFHKFGGEIGHTIVYPNGRRCLCGKDGCLEAYCSAKQIETRYKEETGLQLTTAQIVAQVEEGSPTAQAIWDDAVNALAYALVNFYMLLDPLKIVLGGGVSQAGEKLLLLPTLTKMKEFAPGEELPELSLSSLKEHSGLIGAGYQVYLRR